MALVSDGRAAAILRAVVVRELLRDLERAGAAVNPPTGRTHRMSPLDGPLLPEPPRGHRYGEPRSSSTPPAMNVAELTADPWRVVALVPATRYAHLKQTVGDLGGTVLEAAVALRHAGGEDTAAHRLIATDGVLRELEECIGTFDEGPIHPSPAALANHVARLHRAVRELRASLEPGGQDRRP